MSHNEDSAEESHSFTKSSSEGSVCMMMKLCVGLNQSQVMRTSFEFLTLTIYISWLRMDSTVSEKNEGEGGSRKRSEK